MIEISTVEQALAAGVTGDGLREEAEQIAEDCEPGDSAAREIARLYELAEAVDAAARC